MPKINVLDTFAIPVPAYDILQELGTVSIFTDIPDRHTAVERAKEGDVLVINKTCLDRAVIEQLEGVKLIAETASGYDNIDLDAAREKGIVVSNVPGYSTSSVAEQVFALVLAVARKIIPSYKRVQKEGWLEEPLLGTELYGKTMGIIGFGKIGQDVARIADGFSMRVQVYTGNPDKYKTGFPQYKFVSLDTLLKTSEVVTLHVPHNKKTHHLLNSAKLELMQQDAILINTARGKVVDEEALIAVLKEKKIRAGLDVLSVEPMEAGNELPTLENALVVPHVGWYTHEAVERLMQITHDNIAAFFAGSPQNVVS